MISVIILTKNEEKNISDCLKSVLWCDEVIVIDDHSEDKTAELAKVQGAQVYYHDLGRNFGAQRNYGLAKARQEWVLFLDADERVSEALREEIKTVITSRRNRYAGYYLRRTDSLWGRTLHHGEASQKRLLRLARRDSGTWKGAVHEIWDVKGHTGVLRSALLHYPHQTVSEFLAEINFYTDLRAAELKRKRVKSSWWSVLLYSKGKFIQNYFFRLGLLEGIPGLVSALMMSFHSFLVRSKLWILWNREK